MRIRRLIHLMAVALALTALIACQAGPAPFADVHTHYNWNQAEVTDPDEVAAAFERNNVVLAVVFATPSADALAVPAPSGTRVVRLFSPYITPLGRRNWYRDPEVLERARAGLADGTWAGIGEVHLNGGLGPGPDNRIFAGLVELAREFDVPMLVHTEASSHRFFLPACRDNPDVRFLWAHAGGSFGPDEVRPLMAACPNVHVELSARDPWHYGNLVDADGALRPGWQALFADYPDRFMVGTDPVWNAWQVFRWYEADEGWQHYDDILAFHRGWLAQLPAELERRLRLDNARAFFGEAG